MGKAYTKTNAERQLTGHMKEENNITIIDDKEPTMEEEFDSLFGDIEEINNHSCCSGKDCCCDGETIEEVMKNFINNRIRLAEESLVRKIVEEVKNLERERPMNNFFDTMRRVRGDNIDSEEEVKRRDIRFREERIMFGSHCDALVEVLNLPILLTPKPEGNDK